MNKKNKTQWIFRFLHSFCPDHLYEEIEGDLIQQYQRDVKNKGESKAKRRLIYSVLRFVRPGIVLRNRFDCSQNPLSMTKHFFKTLVRVSARNKTYSFINVTGLVLGITAFTLICLYVWNEKSYDTFHDKKERIFRVRHDRFTNGELNRKWVAGPMGIGSDLKDNFPEVVRYVRLNKGVSRSYILDNGEKSFKERRIFFASEDFFRLFSFPLLKGIDSVVLKDPFTMVVSESMAKRYFGDADPVGRTLKCNGNEVYAITGVFKDLPENTHMQFDALFSFESLWKILGPEETESLLSHWGWEGTYTYIEVDPAADARTLQSKFPAFVEKRMGAQLREWNEWMAFTFQPLTSIHLNSNEPGELAPNGDGQSVQYLMVTALFVLIMAWINYVNLATARSMERGKEVGIRKVLGSDRAQLIRQFLFESFIFNFIATAIAAILVVLLLPVFSSMISRSLDVSVFYSTPAIIFILTLFTIGVIGSGLYPAFIMSGYQPLGILKGFHTSSRGSYLRKGLVTVQFVCSVVLIAGTLVVNKQLHFMKTSAAGIEMEQVLVVHGPTIFSDSTYRAQFDGFRHSLMEYPDVKSVTVSTDVPGHHVTNSNGNVRLVGQDVQSGNVYQAIMASEDFIKTYGLNLIAGRNFSGNDHDEWNTAIANETAMKRLGFTDPEKLIGNKVYLWDSEPEIIGVIKDYHQESLKEDVPPLILVFDKGITQYFSVRIKSAKAMSEIVSRVRAQYGKTFPGNPFDYFFMDDYYNQQYQSDQEFAKIFSVFTTLAIAIACLGLFGLSSYLVVKRSKEISIRKVLGASVRQLAVLVSREFILIVLIANVIAWPVSYFALNHWLNGFAYRIDLELSAFSFLPWPPLLLH
jgi:putative ABC transport system permease protein